MIRAVRLATLWWCVVVGLAVAHADANDASARSFAQAEFKRGKALYKTKDYAGALAAFRAGFQRYPLRGFLVNIGQCHRRLNEYEEAAEAYRQFLGGAGVSDALRREVGEALAEVETHLVDKRPPPPREPEHTQVTPIADPTPPSADPAPEDQPAIAQPDVVAVRPAPRPRTRPWVWGVVGASIGLVVAGAVTVGVVLGTRNDDPSAGSLGLVDGRTR